MGRDTTKARMSSPTGEHTHPRKPANGLVLSGNGIMGVQGGSLTVSNNHWNGGWSSPTKNGTFVDAASTASNSPIWVSTSTYPPANYGFSLTSLQWFGNPNNTYTASTGSYQCYEPDNYITPYSGNHADHYNAASEYIHQTGLYRFLYNNDSIKNSTTDLGDFYVDLVNSNIDYFNRVEQKLSEGDVSGALAINSTITPESGNAVEENYKLFYNLLATWQSGTLEALSVTDSTELADLAFLCPAFNGACVYQARALYNSIFRMEQIYPSCDASGARVWQIAEEKEGDIMDDSEWIVHIFPNPTNGKVKIVSNKETKYLQLTIVDISGRVISSKNINDSENNIQVDFNLKNGIYFLSIKNIQNESVIKKLVISN